MHRDGTDLNLSLRLLCTGRYPNHSERSRLEQEHSKELEKLASPEADFYHGVHVGMLAAFRMIKEHADILHVNQFGDDAIDALLSEASKHQKKMEESVNAFPQIETTELP